MVAKGKVSLAWQCAAAPFTITSLIAFSRIKRLQNAIFMYVLTYVGLAFVVGIVMAVLYMLNGGFDKMTDNDRDIMVDITGGIGLPVMIGVPIFFMRRWCIDWNKKFDSQSIP